MTKKFKVNYIGENYTFDELAAKMRGEELENIYDGLKEHVDPKNFKRYHYYTFEGDTMEEVVEQAKKWANIMIHKKMAPEFSGETAFKLFTEQGLPLDVIRSEIDKKGYMLNEEEFKYFMDEHKRKSKVIKK